MQYQNILKSNKTNETFCKHVKSTWPGAALITAEVTTWCSCLMAVPRARSRMEALLQDFDVGVGGGGGEFCWADVV
jgi:hypothetical protein